jgi:signal transduction histidine kinase
MERSIILPGSNTVWRFTVAQRRSELDGQIHRIRTILIELRRPWPGPAADGGGAEPLWPSPLRRVRLALQEMRSKGSSRVEAPLPLEVQPLVEELNTLLAHNERQAEEARTHAGNLAHALKTPLAVVTTAASAQAPDLAETVLREAAAMRRQVDHHLARARAVGRRGAGRRGQASGAAPRRWCAR